MNFEILSLDFIGTIITTDMVDYFWNYAIPQHYAEEHSLPFEEAKRVVQQGYDEVGPRDLRWYLPKYWLDTFDLKVDVTTLLEESWPKAQVYRDAEKAISILSERHKLIIVSNASREFIEFFLRKKGYKVYRVFSTVSDFSLVAKEPEVYRSISKELGTSSILHVGDDFVQDYLNPRIAGLNSLFLSRDASKWRGKDVIVSLEELLA